METIMEDENNSQNSLANEEIKAEVQSETLGKQIMGSSSYNEDSSGGKPLFAIIEFLQF